MDKDTIIEEAYDDCEDLFSEIKKKYKYVIDNCKYKPFIEEIKTRIDTMEKRFDNDC